VLRLLEPGGHLGVPVLPVLAALDEQSLADVEEAEELLAAVGAEAGDEAVVADGGGELLLDLAVFRLGLPELAQLFAGLLLRLFSPYHLPPHGPPPPPRPWARSQSRRQHPSTGPALGRAPSDRLPRRSASPGRGSCCRCPSTGSAPSRRCWRSRRWRPGA